jgi:hypothetical protein
MGPIARTILASSLVLLALPGMAAKADAPEAMVLERASVRFHGIRCVPNGDCGVRGTVKLDFSMPGFVPDMVRWNLPPFVQVRLGGVTLADTRLLYGKTKWVGLSTNWPGGTFRMTLDPETDRVRLEARLPDLGAFLDDSLLGIPLEVVIDDASRTGRVSFTARGPRTWRWRRAAGPIQDVPWEGAEARGFGFEEERLRVVRSPGEWDSLVDEAVAAGILLGTPPAAPADFERHMLLGAFLGAHPLTGAYWADVRSLTREDGVLVLRVADTSYGKGCFGTADVKYPGILIRVPRSEDPVRIEVEVRDRFPCR